MPGLDVLRVVDPLVRNKVLGYFGEANNIATQVLPVLNVPKRADTIAAFGKELKRQHNTIVTLKQTKPFRDFTLGERAVATRDRYSAYWLSDQELEEWEVPVKGSPAVFCAKLALNDIWRDIELEVANFVMNAGNWAAGSQQAAAAAWANIAFDIPAQVDTQCGVVEANIGVDRSELTLIVGAPCWPWIRRNTAVRLACNYVLGSTVAAAAPIGVITEDIIARALGIKKLIVGRSYIATDIAAVTFYNPWDDDVALMYIPDNMAEVEPLAMPFGCLARREGHPKSYFPYRDTRFIGNPFIYEEEDCIYRNLFETTVGLGTSEAGFAWFNAV